MNRNVKRYVVFAIVAAMAWAITHAAMVYFSEDVYCTPTEKPDSYMYHKSVTCPVVKQNRFKIHMPEGEINTLASKKSRKEQKESCMCWHCSTKPIIIDGFVVIALAGLLAVVEMGQFSGQKKKENS